MTADEEKIRVLCVEDDEYDRELVRFALEKESSKFIITEAANQQEFEEFLRTGKFDIVLTDFEILGFSGIEVIREIKKLQPELPIIVVTGTGSEEIAVQCLKEGVDDYVIKKTHHIARLPHTIMQVLTSREQKRKLKEREDILFAVVNNIADGILLLDSQRVIKFCNPMAENLLGVPTEKLVGTKFDYPLPSEQPCEIELPFRTGGRGVAEVRTTNMIWDGRPHRVVALRDITERKAAEEKRKNLEEQLRQSQRLETIGQLAGGIAHDFNNLLNVILGYSEAALAGMDAGNPFRDDLMEIVKAGRRAAELTRQLLAFGRRQTMEPRVINLNEIVLNMERMLYRLIGENITLKLSLEKRLPNVFADPGQIEQIIMNLVVNARDAIPQTGEIVIETADVELNESYAAEHMGVETGRYVLLSISDNGIGMDEETLSHIFEPFFTTKSDNKGTGLGLAMVYGIVKQIGGHIWVYSEPERGTTFKIYLPSTEKRREKEESEIEKPELIGGSEHILVVEDEPAIREFMEKMLSYLGYTVSIAGNGRQALTIVEDEKLGPDLLITDVIMPEMSGKELVEALKKKNPHLKVLYMSGYTNEVINHHGILEEGVHFLQKPFTMSKLASKIREALAGDKKDKN